MRHRGLKFGLFIPIVSTSLANFIEVWICWKEHFHELIWCGFTNFANTGYTYIVCIAALCRKVQ